MEKKQFIDDIHIKGALTGILLRSQVVSGILTEITTPKLPGNVSLVTARDIPGVNICHDMPIFPEKILSYYGQPVAMLLGPDPEKLRDLATQCTILSEKADDISGSHKKTILIRNFNTGSAAEAFEKAETVVEGRYISGLKDPWPSDPPGAIAVPGPGNTMTIHTASQEPLDVRSHVAQCLDIHNKLVTIEQARLEIHLESKVWQPSLLACQAAVGAKLRNKPVKLILSRREDFFFSPKSTETEIHIQSALDKQGLILGTRAEININFGAFGIFAREILDRISSTMQGVYFYKNIETEGQGFEETIPPAGPIAGCPQGFFAAERHADRIAETLRIDPGEWRKTILGSGKKNPETISLPEMLIEKSEIMSDYRRKWAAYELLRKNRNEAAADRGEESLRGIGISLCYDEKNSGDFRDIQGPKLPSGSMPTRRWGSAVVEAEINPLSYTAKVRGIWICFDEGSTPLMEKTIQHITTLCMAAISWAMQEKISYKNGALDETDYREYSIQIEEYPAVHVDFLRLKNKSSNKSSNKNSIIETLPFSLIPAAYAEALSQALDHPFCHYPINSKDIWEALHPEGET